VDIADLQISRLYMNQTIILKGILTSFMQQSVHKA